MKLRGFLIALLILTSVVSINESFAYEPIPITISSEMDKLQFDGKWTVWNEWKKSTLTEYGGNIPIKLRSAHQGDYIYILADVVGDIHIDKGLDKAVLCFDTKNDKTEIPNEDDYCFVSALGGKNSPTLQGGSPLVLTNHFKQIDSHDDYIGYGSASDENDRYSNIPHATYEYRIPIEVIGRSSIYGFYLGVYDAHTDQTVTWPEGINVGRNEIPSPSLWGEIYSPDKSLPEFELPFLLLIPSMILIILFTKQKRFFKL
ncbi:MAG: hypothetical protein DWQ18_00085 [Crenarchaeota archaeon]|nr:MAG: hypothetical protein DWQ17_05130 [Thermoproteota archaeon]RDJ34391.1 MAG: hypothetical protein DWQ18_00085 [Thermoproteota archaeon]RDJ34729.1 MAG: hypothetical protein DWQ19_13200 [Thermoproteota archaeon]RDJ38670.1 MAG: hypothetical protein DWQ13_04735 [Thermoproteota archaeon]